MTRDRVTGLMAVLLGGFIAFSTSRLPASTMAGDIGPKIFPYIAAGLMMFCGLGLCITGREQSPTYYSREQFGRLMRIFAVVTLYVIVMHYLGYVIATVAGAFVMSTMFNRKGEVLWWKRLIYAVILTAVLYFGFIILLQIPLPAGKL